MLLYICTVLIGLSLFSGLSCRSLQEPASLKTLNFDFSNIADGRYSFNYETNDGTSRQEFGQVLLPGTEDEHMKVNGSFRYLGPDGVFYEVRYTADDQGFHPEGDHFKVPPFVPWIHRHGHNAEKNSNAPKYTDNRDTFNTVGTTPTPRTEFVPKYSPVETKENMYTPSTQLVPKYSPVQTEAKVYTPSAQFTPNYNPVETKEKVFTPSIQFVPKYSPVQTEEKVFTPSAQFVPKYSPVQTKGKVYTPSTQFVPNYNPVETKEKIFTPSTQFLPKYSPVETKENIYRTSPKPTTLSFPLHYKFQSTTSKPTTMYLPLYSNNNDHVKEESKVNFYRPRPTKQYLPIAPNSPYESSTRAIR